MKALPKVAWITSAVAALVASIVWSNLTTNRDLDLVLAYFMAALGFPLALLALMAMGWIFLKLDAGMPVGASGMALLWAVTFVAGYLQWFVFTPALRRALRRSVGRVRRPGGGDEGEKPM